MIPLDSSAQFNVTYANTYKLVHNMALDEYYVLYCTKSAPSLGSTFQSKTYIQIPVKSFAAVDTRALGFLDVSICVVLHWHKPPYFLVSNLVFGTVTRSKQQCRFCWQYKQRNNSL